METRDDRAAREAALPWYGETAVAAYQSGRGFQYGYDFVELILEGYKAYVGGCLRASIIVTGEALLRALYIRITQLLQSRPLELLQGKQALTIGLSSIYNLSDQLTFFQAQRTLSSYLDPGMYEKVDAVRFLRNRAAHGDLPLLDEWDPDDPRSTADFISLLAGTTIIAEGLSLS